jgi:choloylglycine hydrolase
MCTTFMVKSERFGLEIVVGRTFEFAEAVAADAVTYPRGQHFVSGAPGGTQGVAWTTEIGFVSVEPHRDSIQQTEPGLVIDGVNERGLSFNWNLFPYYAVYQDEKARQEPRKATANLVLGAWVLGNFTRVAEVKTAIQTVYVWNATSATAPNGFAMHAIVHHVTGDSAVFEWTEQGLRIYPNPIGVLTNSPPFDWQTTNLQLYLNLRPVNPEPPPYDGITLSPTGLGYGFLGLPGDWSPPSRFVRTATMVRFGTDDDPVRLARHILNAIDIPRGMSLQLEKKDGKDTTAPEFTEWATLADLNRAILYYRSYNDPVLSELKLADLPLTPGSQPVQFPVFRPTP